MLKQKDDQIHGLEAKIVNLDKIKREQGRELDRVKAEAEAFHVQVDEMQKGDESTTAAHRNEVEGIMREHQRHVEDLQQRVVFEEREKHELTANLRSVEERWRAELAHLEAQKAQLELQCADAQVQLQAEQQRCAELCASINSEEARRAAEADLGVGDGPHGSASDVEVRRAAELAMAELQDRLNTAEKKLLDSQSVREMFSKETDMYRTELKVVRDERARLEADLAKARELQATAAVADTSTSQKAVIDAMQRDFEARVERYRDEVQYLRQKGDDKDRRCEQLVAERSSLMVELRSSGGSWRVQTANAIGEDTSGDLEGGGAKAGPPSRGAKSSSGNIRSLPLSAPGWMRSADEPLRLVVRTLNGYPQARLIFFGYVVLLHAWVLFVLQQSAIH